MIETASEPLYVTPLHDAHVALGAKMMPFAGYNMPVHYSGILDEHRAVREAAGLFDVSHMGEFIIQGPEAAEFVQLLVTNDATKLFAPSANSDGHGRAMYTVMCHPDGGAVDDLLVYCLVPDRYLLVVNASNIEKDQAHIEAVLAESGLDCALDDQSRETALLALQGPRAFDIAAALTDLPVAAIPYYHFIAPTPGTFLGCQKALLSHTGYTGEPGLEIYCEAEQAAEVWDALLAAGEPHGLRPAGLGARDTLRLEAGYALYGHELTDETNPLEAGLGWVVKLDAGDFVGADALRTIKAQKPSRRLIGFTIDGRGIPRQGHVIVDDEGQPIGTVTSGTMSPILGRGIGLGYVPNEPAHTEPGAPLHLNVRSRTVDATVVKPPFHEGP